MVGMEITVDSNGRVSQCSVDGSSGSQSLDTAACRNMVRYARYKPATDDAGKPVVGSR